MVESLRYVPRVLSYSMLAYLTRAIGPIQPYPPSYTLCLIPAPPAHLRMGHTRLQWRTIHQISIREKGNGEQDDESEVEI